MPDQPDELALLKLLTKEIEQLPSYEVRRATSHAAWLAGHLGPAQKGAGVEPQEAWRDRLCKPVLRIERKMDGPHLTLGAGCRSSWDSSLCIHQIALMLAVRKEVQEKSRTPAVEALFPLARPAGPEDVLHFVERIISASQPKAPPDGRESWLSWRIDTHGGQFGVSPELRPRLKNGSLGKPREPTSAQRRHLSRHAHCRQDEGAVKWLAAHGDAYDSEYFEDDD